jgi:diguanylate cyclase
VDQILSQLAQSVAAADDLEGLTRPLLELLETITGLESTYLTTIDERRGVQYILYSRNSRKMRIPEGLSLAWGDTLCKRALDEDRPYTNDVSACWGGCEAARALGIQTYLSQPVRKLDGGLYGTLCAASGERAEIPPETIKVLGLFARIIGQQVDRERVFDELKKANQELANAADSDALTGVANRRALVDGIKRMLNQAQRSSSPVHVAFVDLDGFKAINDAHGHAVGDCFLVQIASRLVSGTRRGDLVGRYGGDEFVLVTQLASAEDFRSRIEYLLIGTYALNAVTINYEGASVGVVTSEPGETDPVRLLARADAVMYEIKKSRKTARATQAAAPGDPLAASE